ncbi:MAG: hypothetical protein JWN37_774 [Candidatus Nomurabacteria bacterium]|nr:hypothetical protein [Candidatus Nomurabacteria bacterium]
MFTHNPEVAELKREAIIKGGKALKPRITYRPLKSLRVTNVPDALVLLEDTINNLRKNHITPDQAKIIGSLVSLSFKAIKKDEEDKDLFNRFPELFRR